MERDELIGLIYEASVVGTMWPDVLESIARFVGSVGSSLFVADGQNISNWTSSDSIRDLMKAWIDGGWDRRTSRTKRMFELRRPGFVRDADVFSEEEIAGDEAQQLFLRPNGLGLGAGTFVEIPSGDRAVYSIEHGLARGPFSDDDIALLNSLRPHLARAAILASRTHLARAQNTVRLLDTLGLPAAVIGSGQKLIFSNDRFSGLPEVVFRPFNRISLKDRVSDDVFQQWLERAATLGSSGSVPIHAGEGERPLIAHFMPLSNSAQDLFARGMLLLVLTPVTSEIEADSSFIAGLFDLTPAESRVVTLIVRGQGVGFVAEELRVSRETVRSHLKRSLDKLGVRGQTELAALIASARIGTPPA